MSLTRYFIGNKQELPPWQVLAGLAEYRKLLALVEEKSIPLEEYAREQIVAEEGHLAEISKMMKRG